MPAEGVDTAFVDEQFNAIYPPGVERHYWNRCRNGVIARQLKTVGAKGPMLEIGCGKGLVVADLRARGFDITGVELAEVQPVPQARGHVRTGTDMLSLSDRESERIRTVLLLDVIEHIEDAKAFISSIRSKFPALEWIIYSVPACQELFSNYDRFNGHFRRYDLQTLRAHTSPAQPREFKASYFFHSLYPAAKLQLRTAGERKIGFTVPDTLLSRGLHFLLGAAFYLEYLILPGSIKGTSIIAAVRE